MSFPVVPSGLRSKARPSVTEVRVQSLLLPFYFFCGPHLKSSTMLVGSQLVQLLLVSISRSCVTKVIKIQIVRTATKLSVRPGSDAEFFMSRPRLFRPAELIQTLILIAAELSSKGEKYSFRSNCLQNIRYNNLCIRFGTWKVRVWIKGVPKSLQRRNSRPG